MFSEQERYYRAGYYVARGAFTFLSRMLIAGLIICSVVFYLWPNPTDDTDYDAKRRSGVKLVNDYGTGCQYLETVDGSLYPRMATDGKQICNGEKR